MNSRSILSFFVLVMLLTPAAAQAMDVTEVQRLDFGQFATRDNNQVYTITITPDDEVISDVAGGLVMGDVAGHRGEYDLDAFPPNVTLQTGVNFATPPSGGGVVLNNPTAVKNGGQSFTVSDFTTNNPTTDSEGHAMLYIGATLSTTAAGTNYNTGSYLGTVQLTIYY